MTKTGERVWAALTPRQRELLTKACQAKTNKEIAEEMGLASEQVVKNYLRTVLEKCGCDNKQGLMLFAFYHGLVTCPCLERKHNELKDRYRS